MPLWPPLKEYRVKREWIKRRGGQLEAKKGTTLAKGEFYEKY
jgi:hypothetical protein